MTRKKELTQQIIKFEESKRSIEDYMQLFVKVVSVTRQGSGLMWSDVKDCITDGLVETVYNETVKQT